MVIIFINYSFRWARATTAGDFLNADNAHYSAMIFPVSSKASVLASRNSYKHSPFDRFFRSMVYELVTAEYCCKIFPSKDNLIQSMIKWLNTMIVIESQYDHLNSSNTMSDIRWTNPCR